MEGKENLTENDLFQFVGKDWEFSSLYVDVPTKRGPVKRVFFQDIQFGGNEERWFGVIPHWTATLTPLGWVLDEHEYSDEISSLNTLLFIEESKVLNGMEKRGDAFILESPNKMFTHVVHPAGNNLPKPLASYHNES